MDTNKFSTRHMGISDKDLPEMLAAVGVKSVDELMHQVYPENIFLKEQIDIPEAMTERELAEHLAELASKNKPFTSYIGQGWYDTVTPAPIQRNVLENPVWYTSYTPYQAEVSQGRLEALFNFQTVISELTSLPLTNCSLLDEATAGAEAAMLLFNERSRAQVKAGANTIFVDKRVFETTQAVIRTRVEPQGMKLVVGDYQTLEFTPDIFGVIIQYPDSVGAINNYEDFVAKAKANGSTVAVAADLMSLPESGVLMLFSARLNALVSPCILEAPLPVTWLAVWNTNARYPGVSLVSLRMLTGTPLTAWLSRLVSNTSNAKKRPQISVQPRLSLPR